MPQGNDAKLMELLGEGWGHADRGLTRIVRCSCGDMSVDTLMEDCSSKLRSSSPGTIISSIYDGALSTTCLEAVTIKIT